MASLRFNYGGGMTPRTMNNRPYRYTEVLPVPPEAGEILYRKTNSLLNMPARELETTPEIKADKEQPEVVICTTEGISLQDVTTLEFTEQENPSFESASAPATKAEEQGISEPPVAKSPAGPIDTEVNHGAESSTGSAGTELTKEALAEVKLSDSERFVASIDNYETSMVRISQQLDKGKILFDQALFYMDSFLKILEVIKETEQRKQQGPQVSSMIEKEKKDTVDEILELLQTPVFQNILRQVLMGIIVKK